MKFDCGSTDGMFNLTPVIGYYSVKRLRSIVVAWLFWEAELSWRPA